MSHTVKIAVQFKTSEFSQLTTAFKALHWGVIANGTARQYSGTKSYPFVAVNPDKTQQGYDIGIVKGEKEVNLFSDFYGGSVECTLGRDLNKLKQEFAAAVIENEFENSSIARSTDQHGNLMLEVTQW